MIKEIIMRSNNYLLLLKFSILILLISLFTTIPSFAGGKMSIEPIVYIGYQRDTNFNKSETNAKAVDTYSIGPILQLSYTTDKSEIMLQYSVNMVKYKDQDKNLNGQVNADTLNYTKHDAVFAAQAQLTERLLLGFDAKLSKSRDPETIDSNSNSIDYLKHTVTTLSSRAAYGFAEKFGLDMKYTKQYIDYQDNGSGQGEDSEENRGRFTLNYNFNSKTSFDLDYQVWTHEYDKTSTDYTSNQLMFNLNRQFSYFTLTAGVGYQSRKFDQAIETGDIEQPVWRVAVSGQDSKSSVSLSAGNDLNNYGYGNDYYKSTYLKSQLGYLLTERINCTLKASLQNYDYETSSRNDNYYSMSLGTDYYLNNSFSFGVEGGSEKRNSNQIGQDFDNKYFMLNARFYYKTGPK